MQNLNSAEAAVAMWEWVDIDENRRLIRFDTLGKQWRWVDEFGQYHNADQNTFSSAVFGAMTHYRKCDAQA